jgi:hypothetical protein
MRNVKRYVGAELQRPRFLLIKILLVALFIFFVVLWHEHQALSAAAKPEAVPSSSLTKRPAHGGPPDVSIIVLAQSKHLVHTRNCLRAVNEHVSMNSAFIGVATYEIIVMEVGYEYHRRNGLRKALSLCPECSLVLTNDSMLFYYFYFLFFIIFIIYFSSFLSSPLSILFFKIYIIKVLKSNYS